MTEKHVDKGPLEEKPQRLFRSLDFMEYKLSELKGP